MALRKLKVALLCGGPSLERGISLNSARSVCDHLQSDLIEITPIYFDYRKQPYLISRDQLYSNTPSDFDFKLKTLARQLSKASLFKLLKSVDVAFPVMHGAFGEDGQIQSLLEEQNIPYVGSDKWACRNCFDKYKANEFIKKNGFFTLPSEVIKIHEPETHKEKLTKFFKEQNIKRAIVKPATGGSSIGVHSVNNVEQALQATRNIFNKKVDTRVVVEPFAKGIEFTVIILENHYGMPVALFPTEIETDYSDHQLFDFRKKYLATRQVTYHCPPRFPLEVTEKIQIQAQHLFQLLGMRDFARFDGWLLDDGNIWFSDFNPISGMEQNSFLFLQAAQLGFSHSDLLKYIIQNSCNRYEKYFPTTDQKATKKKQPINVVFGGGSSERQVSVMSGTNTWLKLRKSDKYEPHPYLLDTDEKTVWRLPYSKTLNHTVEEISENCKNAEKTEKWIAPLRRRVIEKLDVTPGHLNEELFLPKSMALSKFIRESERVFIGLHGGIGENGKLQEMLEKAKVPFNGSGSKASQLCMDKYATGQKLMGLEKEGIHVPQKILLKTSSLFKLSNSEIKKTWKSIRQGLGSSAIIVKPTADGCSVGIAKLLNSSDLAHYINFLKAKRQYIPKNTLKDQHGMIELPTHPPNSLMFEQFIFTDKVRVVNNQLKWKRISGWIEITMGLLGRGEKIKALNPSLTVAKGTVLSLEEKFQGGTGVNITPPPVSHIKKANVEKAKKRMEKVAKALGISGYARIDAFMEVDTGEIMIIEANTTPALTAATVIYHQALTEKPPLYPRQFLEKIIDYSS